MGMMKRASTARLFKKRKVLTPVWMGKKPLFIDVPDPAIKDEKQEAKRVYRRP